LAVGVGNLVLLQGMSSRLDALAVSQRAVAQKDSELERRSRRPGTERARDRGRADGVGSAGGRGPRVVSPAAVDLDDPVVVDELTARLADRLEARETADREVRHQIYVDEATEEVRRFAEQRDWSDRTTEEVIIEVQAQIDSWNSMRQDMRDGLISRVEGRREKDDLREESDAKMLTLMSQDELDALSETVFGGPRGERKRP
jgi:hypothetical protein